MIVRLKKLGTGWTVIATRPRAASELGQTLTWTPTAGAWLHPLEAHRLVKEGWLLASSRHHPAHIEFLIRPSAKALDHAG
jgi:hypothetical protein